jgi:hypothetical protein
MANEAMKNRVNAVSKSAEATALLDRLAAEPNSNGMMNDGQGERP